jgi:hypothetical protein
MIELIRFREDLERRLKEAHLLVNRFSRPIQGRSYNLELMNRLIRLKERDLEGLTK